MKLLYKYLAVCFVINLCAVVVTNGQSFTKDYQINLNSDYAYLKLMQYDITADGQLDMVCVVENSAEEMIYCL